MVIFLIILISLVAGILLFRMVYNYVQKEIQHNVRMYNLFLERFLSSDDYLAKSYAKRSKLDEFQIIPIEKLSSKKAIREYYRLQDSSLENLRKCFKCRYATFLIDKNPDISSLMDLERTCLQHKFCSSCEKEFSCQSIRGLTCKWGLFYNFKIRLVITHF